MKVISKIKTLLKAETIKNLAAVCDTRRLSSNIEKMKLAMKVVLEDRKDVIQIGGATNRIVIQLEGYIVKIAVDAQGYEDNMMEFSICEELYPDVTKSFETNGYILVAQTVRLPTKDEWRQRRAEILRILDRLSKDYLLGDVGYDDLNRTNWGITDDGRLVMLDYAYVHRATEKLFTCPECGEGVLTYDQNYTILMCANTAQCHARYTYSEMKRIQGDKVDRETIAERLTTAIVMPGDVFEQETVLTHGSTLVGDDDVVVIHNNLEYRKFMEEEEGNVPIGAVSIPMTSLEKHDQNLFTKMIQEYGPVEGGKRYRRAIGIEEPEEPEERPKRKWILADDYYEYRLKPVSAKPIDRNYGETQEEYEERKKEEKNSKEELNMLDLRRRLIDMPHAQAYYNGGSAYERAEPATSSDYDESDDEDTPYTGETYMGMKPMVFTRPDTGKGKRKKVPALGETYDSDGNVWLGRHRVDKSGPLFLGKTSNTGGGRKYTEPRQTLLTKEYIAASEKFTAETLKLKSVINNGRTQEERERAAIAYSEMIKAGVEQFMVGGGGTPDDQKSAPRQNAQPQQKQQKTYNTQGQNNQKKKKNATRSGAQLRAEYPDRKTMLKHMTPGGTTAQMYDNCNAQEDEENPRSEPTRHQSPSSGRLTGTIGSMVTMPVLEEEPAVEDDATAKHPQHAEPVIEQLQHDSEQKTTDTSFNAQHQRPVLGSTSREPEESTVEPVSLTIDGKEVSIDDSH